MLLSTCTLSTLLGKYCTFIIQVMTLTQINELNTAAGK